MGFLAKLLGGEREGPRVSTDASNIQTEIEVRLSKMPVERARHLAAFAGLLGRVADADLNISPEEMDRIRRILREQESLSPEEAELVADVLHEQTKALAGLQNHIYTRVIRETVDRGQRVEILRALFMVAAAEDDISSVENEEIRAIAKGLGLTHEEFIAARSEFTDKLSVIKGLSGP